MVVEKELLTNYIQLAMVVLGKASFYRFPYNFSQLFFKREQAQITFLRTVSVRLRSLAKKLLIHLLLFFKFDKKLPFIHYRKSK